MALKTITFTCETITPMFLSGADGSTPELRPPSIKGALRFWWRAMNGGDYRELKKREDEIFGSTKIKSKLLISIIENWKCSNSEYVTKQNYTNKYLFFPLQMLDERKGIPAGKNFTIELASKDDEVLKQGVCAFWLLSFLGGIGFRARRGGGNIYSKPIEGDFDILKELEIDFCPRKNEGLEEFLQRNLNICKLNIARINIETESLDYSNLIGSRIIISNTPSSLAFIEGKYKDFRSTRKGNNFLMLKAAFGLPLESKMPNPPIRPRIEQTKIKIVTEDKDQDRRSSPIIIRMIKINDNTHWLVLRLNGIYLDKDISLVRLNVEEIVIENQPVNESLLTLFLEELIENDNIEITL